MITKAQRRGAVLFMLLFSCLVDSIHARTHDLYLWKTAAPRPAGPTKTGLAASNFTPAAALAKGTAYSWLVVAKNTNAVTSGTTWRFTTAP